MNIFEKIKHNFLQRKKQEMEEKKINFTSKITFKNQIMSCIPVLDIFNTIYIHKNINKFPSDFDSEIFSLKILTILGTLFSLILFCIFPKEILSTFLLSIFSVLSLLSGIFYYKELQEKNISKIIKNNILKNVLEKEDFKLLKENVSIDILSNFMAKNDFKITYENLDFFIKEYAYKEDENKAKEIILSKAINKQYDDILITSKEKIVVD